MLQKAIQDSFLLSDLQKEYLINNIDTISETDLDKILEILSTEKDFTLSLLKKYKNDGKNTSIVELKWELINENLKRMKKLELSEIEIFDIEKEFENII